MDIEIAPSARCHGVADEDMLHAPRSAIRMLESNHIDMFIGPDQSTRLLEVGVLVRTDAAPLIIHAMPARKKYLR